MDFAVRRIGSGAGMTDVVSFRGLLLSFRGLTAESSTNCEHLDPAVEPRDDRIGSQGDRKDRDDDGIKRFIPAAPVQSSAHLRAHYPVTGYRTG